MVPRFAPVLIAVALALPACTGMRGRLGAGYMQSQVRGDVGLAPSNSSSAKPPTQSVDAFGQGGSNSNLMMQLSGDLDRWRGRVTAFRFDSSGVGVLQAPFGDLAAGSAVQSEVDVTSLKVGAYYDVVHGDAFRLGLGVAADYLDFDLNVLASSVTASESLAATVVVPMPAASLEFEKDWFIGTADFGAMAADLGDADGTYFDFEVTLGVRPTEEIELFAGYRWLSVDAGGMVNGQAYDANIDISGWFLGGAVRIKGPTEPGLF